MNSHHLTYDEQLQLLKDRGILGIASIDDPHHIDQLKSISTIGYYKLKQYMYNYWSYDDQQYLQISYDNIIARYYHDQQLKQALFQAIGDIEAFLNTTISHILGKQGPVEYTNFKSWCQNSGYNKFISGKRSRIRNHWINVDKYVIKREELSFLSRLLYKLEHSDLKDIQRFENSSTNVFPSVWLMVNTLTFGESIYLLRLMSRKNKRLVAQHFHKPVSYVIKSLELLNLIRNICCHNGDLVDIKLRTLPFVPKKFKPFLDIKNGNMPPKVSIALCIALDLLREVNPKYKVNKEIQSIFLKLCNTKNSCQKMGFKNVKSIKYICNIFYDLPTSVYYPNGSYINL